MISFDPTLLRVEQVYLKYVTKALGGSINVLDENNTSDKETFIKIQVPLHVADAFIKYENLTRFMKPVLSAITYYDNMVIAIEKHPLGALGKKNNVGLFGNIPWVPASEKSILGVFKDLTEHGTWYIDGTVVYRFNNEKSPTNLTTDGKFQSVVVDAIKLSDMPNTNAVKTSNRVCIAYHAANGQIVVSPPIWRDMNTVGANKIGTSIDDDDKVVITKNQFDKVDAFLAVNLGFALKAAKELSDEFGYVVIEPLRLDDLMIQLKTVNLQRVDLSIKRTHDIGMKFTHAVAWIIGMTDKVNTLESFRVIRALLRYLTTRGIFHKTAMSKESIYTKGMGINDVPLLSIEQAENASNLITT